MSGIAAEQVREGQETKKNGNDQNGNGRKGSIDFMVTPEVSAPSVKATSAIWVDHSYDWENLKHRPW